MICDSLVHQFIASLRQFVRILHGHFVHLTDTVPITDLRGRVLPGFPHAISFSIYQQDISKCFVYGLGQEQSDPDVRTSYPNFSTCTSALVGNFLSQRLLVTIMVFFIDVQTV